MDHSYSGLSLLDYFVLILMLSISVAIGVYYRFTGGKQRTLKEYLHADKNSSIFLVSFSFMASAISAISMLGYASELYNFGTGYFFHLISLGICFIIDAYFYLPIFYHLQITSANEYLERRFGKTSRLAASLCVTFKSFIYMGIALDAPAIALEAVTGISRTTAILTTGLVCTVYSTIGGMKAVLMTDLFQGFLMYGSLLSIFLWSIFQGGGLKEIWKHGTDGHRIQFPESTLDPTVRHSWMSVVSGASINFLFYYAVGQINVQRCMTLKDEKSAKIALFWSWPLCVVMTFFMAFTGLAAYSKYYNCDPVSINKIANADQILPYYVLDTMGHIPGLNGIFVAGIFSAVLSTVSASLNAQSANILEDYIKPLYKMVHKREMPEEKLALKTKLIVLILGFVSITSAFSADLLGSLLQASTRIAGAIGGPVLAFFSLGMFSTKPNEKGALTGLISGMAISLFIAFGPKVPPETLPMRVDGCQDNITLIDKTPIDQSKLFYLHRISYYYNGVVGLLITAIVGYFASILVQLFSKETEQYDPNLFISPIRKRLESRYKSDKISKTDIIILEDK